MPGIAAISGSIKNEKDGSRIVFKTYNKRTANGGTKTETRMYIMPKQERSNLPSPKETAQRTRFQEASDRIKNLSDEEKKRWWAVYKINKGVFNGKHYATLRGYLMAVFLHDANRDS